MAKLSDAPVYEYLYTHTATFSLYNTLVTPLWKAIPMVKGNAFPKKIRQ